MVERVNGEEDCLLKGAFNLFRCCRVKKVPPRLLPLLVPRFIGAVRGGCWRGKSSGDDKFDLLFEL